MHLLGHPRGHDDGIEAQALIAGPGGPGGEWVQLDAERVTGYRVQQGFSGAGVVDSKTGAVVGILVSEASDAVAKVCWMMPLAGIAHRLPDLALDFGELDFGEVTSPGESAGGGISTLPPAIHDFVGRHEELERLHRGISDRGISDHGDALAIHAISGMGGIGKTTLAVQLAHDLAGRYPDAQLFIDLQAHTGGAEGEGPLAPGTALARLLRTLGVIPHPQPSSNAEWAELWRAELTRRRVLVVFDNAASAEQVRRLLPGTTQSLALVTSRNRLIGLEQVTELQLDVLPEEDARTLFTRVVGAERAAREPVVVEEILALCGRLPLAVRLVATRLRSHPTWTAADLLRDIKSERRRLEKLHLDDDTEVQTAQLSVRTAFGLSYRDLRDDEKRLFRRLGLHPSAEFSSYAAAALDGTDLRAGRRILERLVNRRPASRAELGPVPSA